MLTRWNCHCHINSSWLQRQGRTWDDVRMRMQNTCKNIMTVCITLTLWFPNPLRISLGIQNRMMDSHLLSKQLDPDPFPLCLRWKLAERKCFPVFHFPHFLFCNWNIRSLAHSSSSHGSLRTGLLFLASLAEWDVLRAAPMGPFPPHRVPLPPLRPVRPHFKLVGLLFLAGLLPKALSDF